MGKKNKRYADASTSQGPQKRTKTESSLPQPSSSPQLSMVKYEDMPPNHKRQFYVDDDRGGLKKYIELITWLRTMGSFDGSVFDGIGNLNCSGQSYPLLEVEVITPSYNAVKFIIAKITLYLIAFYAQDEGFQFDCEFVISPFTKLEGFRGEYTTKPWIEVGPKCMIDAVDFLATQPFGLAGMPPVVAACEKFFVHFSEAARLCPVESLICRSLVPPKAGKFDKRAYEEEENWILRDDKSKIVESDDDVYLLVEGDGPLNSALTIATPSFIENLIKKFSNLSKVWYVFSLSGRKCFPMAPHDVSRFRMRSVKSLRGTLGVLCNINLEKVLQEWRKKSSNHNIITPVVFEGMERKVRELQLQNKVFLPN